MLQRRETPNPDPKNSGWLRAVEVAVPDGMVTVNEYYKQNPGHILGRLNFGTGSTYGRPSMIVDRPYDIETRITQLSTRVPENTYARRTTVKKTIQYVTNNTKGHTLVFYSPYRTP